MKPVMIPLAMLACALALPPTTRAAVSFTDLNAGMTALDDGSTAWGDYDNDGDLDVAAVGLNYDVGRLARIYRNDSGTFVLTSALPAGAAVSQGALAWGDYDQDGDLDLAIAGSSGAGNVTKIFRNTAGVFADIGAGLEGLAERALAWADLDNDGDLDLAVSGTNGSVPKTVVYRNTAGVFADAGLGLIGRQFSSLAWADYNRDGDNDLIVTGADEMFNGHTNIYGNNGGTLPEVPSAFPETLNGDVEWGDHDNDGDPDLLFSGEGMATQVWNNNAGSFSLAITMQDVHFSSTVWGDYDNDSRLDIALGGATGSIPLAAVYHNNGGSFSNINAGLPEMWHACFAWGDYDNDGDLDLLLAGGDEVGGKYHRIYRSTGVAVVNTPPTAPTNLSVTTTPTTITFHWNASTDAQGGPAGLSYNLWAGTAPGTPNVMSPMANLANGFRRVAQLGNVGQNLQWTLKRSAFAGGVVYWGVQAIDQAFKGSAFTNGPSGTLDVTNTPAVARLELRLADSNPCSGDARLAYVLPRAGSVDLAILDVTGRRVQTLAQGEQTAGEHEARWAGDDVAGSRVAPGLYFARVAASGETATLRIVAIH